MRRLALMFAASLTVAAAPKPSAGLQVEQGWSRPAAAGGVAAGYMTIRNSGTAEQTLVRVESPIAARAELHRSMTGGGMARMRPVARLPVPAGGETRLAPGGVHVMLIGLKKTTAAGQKLPATLVFASGARIATTLTVGQTAPAAPGGEHHHH